MAPSYDRSFFKSIPEAFQPVIRRYFFGLISPQLAQREVDRIATGDRTLTQFRRARLANIERDLPREWI